MTAEEIELFNAIRAQNAQLVAEKGSLVKEVEYLRGQLKALAQRIYGRRSERFENPEQLDLLETMLRSEQEAVEPPAAPEVTETIQYTRRKPADRGPKPLPEGLPRDRVEIDPAESERTCACCKRPMDRVDEKVTEELTVKPPEFRVRQYVRGVYRCKSCMNRNVEASLPPRPIERGRPSPSLLAYLVTSKYVDHLPLYRQEQIFARYGIHLPRSTMDEWFGRLSGLLLPIVEAMKRKILESKFLQSDDTLIQVLDREVKGKSRRCYIWVYGVPKGEVVYQFTTSRAQRWPREFLGNWSGHLQCDGYSGYNEIFRDGRIQHIACMAHVRRKMLEAKDAAPKEIDEILTVIQQLYAIEDEIKEKGLEGDAVVALRKEKAAPILEDLLTRLHALAPRSTPKSKLGRAVKYAVDEWPAMLRYLEVPEAFPDNNWCENAMRPLVLCRKNFLFLGSVEGGGERAEVFFSLAQTCQRLRINPFTYLTDVIERVSTHPASRVWELTPRGWAEARATEMALAPSAG
jgi:transposase